MQHPLLKVVDIYEDGEICTRLFSVCVWVEGWWLLVIACPFISSKMYVYVHDVNNNVTY